MQRNAVVVVLALLLAPYAGIPPAASAHPTDSPHRFVWEGHWTATWDANGAWSITEEGDFMVYVAFGGPGALPQSSGTGTVRVTQVQSEACQIQAPPLPSVARTVLVRAAVSWGPPPRLPGPTPGTFTFSVVPFMPIMLNVQARCGDSQTWAAMTIPSIGTHGAFCRFRHLTRLGPTCLTDLDAMVFRVQGLRVTDTITVQGESPGQNGSIIDRVQFHIEASARCPAPGRAAWVLYRVGSDLNSATVNGRPAFDLGATVPTHRTALATDATGTLAVQFGDLSELWLAPSSRASIAGVSCSPNTGMQINLVIERGRAEIIYGGHLGGRIDFFTLGRAASATMTYHPARHRGF